MTCAVVLLSAAVGDVVDGSMRRLYEQLPAGFAPTPPSVHRYNIDKNDAGIGAQVRCTRGDGRLVSWLVDVWIYPTGREDWSANVKAEIDLDDSFGEDRCVLNDQQFFADAAAAAQAVERAAALVTEHPRADLLVSGWEPPEWAEDESSL